MITVSGLTKSYGSGEGKNQVLQGIGLQFSDGDFVVVLGASGSGKSTFLNIISGLERPDSGSVSYGPREITKLSDRELARFRRENIGFIFQQYYLLPNMTAEKNIRMGADLADNGGFEDLMMLGSNKNCP